MGELVAETGVLARETEWLAQRVELEASQSLQVHERIEISIGYGAQVVAKDLIPLLQKSFARLRRVMQDMSREPPTPRTQKRFMALRQRMNERWAQVTAVTHAQNLFWNVRFLQDSALPDALVGLGLTGNSSRARVERVFDQYQGSTSLTLDQWVFTHYTVDFFGAATQTEWLQEASDENSPRKVYNERGEMLGGLERNGGEPGGPLTKKKETVVIGRGGIWISPEILEMDAKQDGTKTRKKHVRSDRRLQLPRLVFRDGDSCGAIGLRNLVADLRCGRALRLAEMRESTACHYTAIIETPQACQALRELNQNEKGAFPGENHHQVAEL